MVNWTRLSETQHMPRSVSDDGTSIRCLTLNGLVSSRCALRICPGRYMAFSAVWIGIASLIAAFDITKAVDENGDVIEPSQEYSSALVVYVFGLKSQNAKLLILSNFAACPCLSNILSNLGLGRRRP
jgi:hypothetical protein